MGGTKLSTRPRYLCQKEKDGKLCGNTLRELSVGHNDSNLIDRSYLRYCDVCHTVYLLVPKELELEHFGIPLLEHLGLTQMEEH